MQFLNKKINSEKDPIENGKEIKEINNRKETNKETNKKTVKNE